MVEIKNMVHKSTQSTKEDPLTAIRESWNYFHKEYCFKLVKFMPEIHVIKGLHNESIPIIFVRYV